MGFYGKEENFLSSLCLCVISVISWILIFSTGYHLLCSLILTFRLLHICPLGVPLRRLLSFCWPLCPSDMSHCSECILAFCLRKILQDHLVLARPRSSWKNSPETVFLAPSGGELHTHTHRLHLSLLLSVDHLSHEFTPALPVQVQVHRVNSSSPISISPTIRNLTTITTM